MGYLASKYAKNDSLYPKDPKKRGMVDQMLYFDAGSLHENMIKCYVRILYNIFIAVIIRIMYILYREILVSSSVTWSTLPERRRRTSRRKIMRIVKHVSGK